MEDRAADSDGRPRNACLTITLVLKLRDGLHLQSTMPRRSSNSKTNGPAIEIPHLVTRAFRERVVRWYLKHGRDFPWRNTTNQYRLLIAEVMLQRTRARQVLPVYQRFLSRFPNEKTARTATPEQLAEILAPLGMQRKRTERLRRILTQLSRDSLVDDPRRLMAFDGVGPYTSGAVAIFGLNQEGALLDTNVARVVSRVFDVKLGTEPHKRKANWEMARSLVPRTHVREYHWGLIDLASEICRPRKPLCASCPLRSICAYPRRMLL